MQDSPTPTLESDAESADTAATLADLAVRLAFLVRARLWLQIVLALVLGQGLITNHDTESWMTQRRMMQPMFHKRRRRQ